MKFNIFEFFQLGFIASNRAFNLPTRAFSLLTRGFELVTRGFEFIIRRSKLVTRGFELVTRILLICPLIFENLFKTYYDIMLQE